MTVSELIAHLQTFPPHLPVAYGLYSEYCLLAADEVAICEACPPRPDGWIQRKRPDTDPVEYVMFPGN